MRPSRRWLVGLAALLARRAARRRARAGGEEEPDAGPIVPPGPPDQRAENVVLALLGLATVLAVGFVVVYAEYSPTGVPNQLLGVCLGGCLAAIAAALAVLARRLVVSEELEEDYPPERHPADERAVAEIVGESGSRITRKRLLVAAGATTGGALGLATLTPVLSIGPVWDTAPLYRTPWRRGVRLVDRDGRPFRAQDVEPDTFYTAFPEGADRDLIGSPVVMVRLEEAALRLPADRAGWAPLGILAYSKICPHAGCAIALYRKPTFAAVEPRPALVCPCHYSTFDPATGGSVIYGPAGRPLPQLPLSVDATGLLRAAGNFAGPVGPSWWGVRSGGAT
jgi:ubiquinol-cytochrome c reductase iron-sulfur subunit